MKRSRGRDFGSRPKRPRASSIVEDSDSETSESVSQKENEKVTSSSDSSEEDKHQKRIPGRAQQPSCTSARIYSSARTYSNLPTFDEGPVLSQDTSWRPSGLASSLLNTSVAGSSSYVPALSDRNPTIPSYRDTSRTPSGLQSSLFHRQTTQRQLPSFDEIRGQVVAGFRPQSGKQETGKLENRKPQLIEIFGPDMLAPPHISLSTDNAIKVVRDMYLTLDRLHLHDMLLLIRKVFSRKDTENDPLRQNMSLRASRLAVYLPNQFINVGKLLASGAFGEAYLVKTPQGKRYVLKKETQIADVFHDDIRHVMKEKNAMIVASDCESIIKIKGSWYFATEWNYVSYTIMEYADFGTLNDYMELCRPGMKGLIREEGWQNADVHGKATLLEMALNASREMDDADEDFRKGFRAILLRFSAELINGIMFLHQEGISHNDLHGGNILIGREFHIKIADFGLAIINHPLYSLSLYENPGQEVAETAGMNLFQYPERLDNDFEAYLNFLVQITSGISRRNRLRNELMVFIEYPETDEFLYHIIPEFRSVIYFDNFLMLFSELINKLAMEEGYPKWDAFFENELAIFYELHGGEYLEYDYTPYVLKLYNKASIGFNTKLQSIADIDQNAGWPTDLPIHESVGGQSRFACVGYMDESFLREAGAEDMYEDDYQPDDEAEVQAS